MSDANSEKISHRFYIFSLSTSPAEQFFLPLFVHSASHTRIIVCISFVLTESN